MDRIKNEYISENIHGDPIEDKMKGCHLIRFGHVFRKLELAPI